MKRNLTNTEKTSMTLSLKFKRFIFFIITFSLILPSMAIVYVQQLPPDKVPHDFPSGWYTTENNHFFINPSAGIYLSMDKPVERFSFEREKMSTASLPDALEPVELIPQTLEGHALKARVSMVDSFQNIQPIFSDEMGLLSISLAPAHDHFQNHCNIIDVSTLEKDQHFIYFIHAFSPTNLKIAPAGRIEEDFTYLLNNNWITYGNIHTVNEWILGTLQPGWFESGDTLHDLYFMINDHPTEYSQATHHFLLDGLFIVTGKELYSDIMAPNVDIIGLNISEILLSQHPAFYIIVLLFFSSSLLLGSYIYKICRPTNKKLS